MPVTPKNVRKTRKEKELKQKSNVKEKSPIKKKMLEKTYFGKMEKNIKKAFKQA